MPCYYPITGYRAKSSYGSGKRGVVFNRRDGFIDLPVTLACGQCVGCRLERSRQWAIRCVHEAQLHQDNCFVTLTYDDEHLPYGGTLVKADFQKFMKRLRERVHEKISFFHCGEYGEPLDEFGRRKPYPCISNVGRPHYHALLFGVSFPDQVLYKKGESGSDLYTSELLGSLWTSGFSTVGALTFESAAYCARYVMKKVSGPGSRAHYMSVVFATGEMVQVLPEYITMSLKPAIGKRWYEEFSADVFPGDFVVVRGQRMRPPRYYDRLLEGSNPVLHAVVKADRVDAGREHRDDQTPERLRVREQVKRAQIGFLRRDKA